jgi:hypothetical protein
MHWPHLTLRATLAAVALTVLAAPIAFAGGWAITTLDELPASLKAGETYSIGYTIRQHGLAPFTTTQSGIEIRDPKTGARQRFAGIAEGAPGHYVAQVRFPEPGEWEWLADQTPFQAQALGAISVVPVAASPPVAPAAPLSVAAPAAVSVAAPAEVNAPAAAQVTTAIAAAPVEPLASGQVSAPALTSRAPAADGVAPAAVSLEQAWPAPLRVGLPIATVLATGLFAWRLLTFIRPRSVARGGAPAAAR